MSVTVQKISDEAGILLQDESLVRWPLAERLKWINDGRRIMARAKPEVFGNGTAVSETLTALTCAQRVTTPEAYQLVTLDFNDGSGKAIRPTTKQQLDAFRSAWRNDTAADVQNWFPDETDPLRFWVYPAPNAANDIVLHVHLMPVDLIAAGDTALPYDIYAPALVSYVCAMALAKEDEAAALAKSANFLQLFQAALA